MHSVLNLVKWLLICVVFLLWLALSLINHAVSTALVVFPGYLEFEHVPLAVILIFPLVVAFVTFYVVGLLDQVGHMLSSRELKK
ncbi:MAG: hypothetical protein P8Z49_02615, partial [Acidobacteriota bacterium]